MSELTLIIISIIVLVVVALFLFFKRPSPKPQSEHPWVEGELIEDEAEDVEIIEIEEVERANHVDRVESAERIERIEPIERAERAVNAVKVSEVDQNVLNQLRAAGSDLSKPHDMEFYLRFPTQELANEVADEIEAEGFTVEVKRVAEDKGWLCYVTKKMVPEGPKITVIGERFSTLAREYEGEYDGWETSVVN
jgi:regulator of ribonuclease activity B